MKTRSAFPALLTIALMLLATSVAAQDTSTHDPGAANPPVRGACPSGACPPTPPTVITGAIGSCGDWPQCVSGTQTGRLNRNLVIGSCATPKSCLIFNSTPGYEYDAYTITNGSGATACVAVTLNVITQTGCNLEPVMYLNTYDPANICEPQSDFLSDPGSSSGSPPVPVGPICGDVPAGQDLIIVVHSTNVGGAAGCQYQLVMSGDCIPVELMDFNVLDD